MAYLEGLSETLAQQLLADDMLVVIASHLRSYEAGMLRGLLESAGIPADLIDTWARQGDSLLTPIVDGGAKVVVLATDAERAREIIRSAGVFPGSAQDEPVEIPEEEWSRGA